MLEAGEKIPNFTLIDDTGEKISSKSLKGQKFILYFYPKDDTPGCTKEAEGFKALHSKIKREGYLVYGVSKDGLESHQKFKKKYKLPFPLLSDPELQVAKKFGAWGEKNMYGKKTMGLIRSTFLVDEKGKIEKSYKVRRAAQHPEKVLSDISS